MKILVVCQYYTPEPFRIADICEGLVRRGHSVTVVTGTPNYPEGEIYPGYEKGARRDEILEGVRVHRCPTAPRKKGAFHRFLNYYSFVFSAKKYLRRCREDFDVVFVNQLSPVMMAEPGLCWARRNQKKCLLYCLDLWPESLQLGGIRKGNPIYQLFLGISRRIYGRADRVAVSSHAFLAYFDSVLGMDASRIAYLPQYAESLFGELPEPEKKPGETSLVFAGNIGNLQSVETIVEAAQLLAGEPGIHIHIVGGGISLDRCREMAEGLTNITFYGRRPLEDMPGFYAMADAMLITLVSNDVMSMNLPGKVQSYLAAGKPVLGAVNGETQRLIRQEQCGVCVPAEDAKALAQAMLEAAAAPETWKQYGKNARACYEKYFTEETFLDSLEKLLRETAERAD